MLSICKNLNNFPRNKNKFIFVDRNLVFLGTARIYIDRMKRNQKKKEKREEY
jgi:hypothetical protein